MSVDALAATPPNSRAFTDSAPLEMSGMRLGPPTPFLSSSLSAAPAEPEIQESAGICDCITNFCTSIWESLVAFITGTLSCFNSTEEKPPLVVEEDPLLVLVHRFMNSPAYDTTWEREVSEIFESGLDLESLFPYVIREYLMMYGEPLPPTITSTTLSDQAKSDMILSIKDNPYRPPQMAFLRGVRSWLLEHGSIKDRSGESFLSRQAAAISRNTQINSDLEFDLEIDPEYCFEESKEFIYSSDQTQ